jgi:hypothetical protein
VQGGAGGPHARVKAGNPPGHADTMLGLLLTLDVGGSVGVAVASTACPRIVTVVGTPREARGSGTRSGVWPCWSCAQYPRRGTGISRRPQIFASPRPEIAYRAASFSTGSDHTIS